MRNGRIEATVLAVDWVGPVCLAGAAAFSAQRFGVAPSLALIAGIVALAVGAGLMKLAEPTPQTPGARFEPLDLAAIAAMENELLLDDPLPEPGSQSRVVKLFVKPQPTPGQLAGRIAHFLADQPPPALTAAASPEGDRTDASEALHAALASIRASLR